MNEVQTPSARIIADAQKTKTIVDAAGRSITFRSLSVLDQARILKAIGAAQSENGPYVRLACIALSVMEIDGVPVPRAVNDAGVEAAISRLGDEGFMALSVDMERRAADARQAAEEAMGGPVPGPLAAPAT